MRVRMGIHTGGAECRDGDCDGLTLNRAARLMSIGYGGQVLVSDAAETLTRNDRRAGAAFANLGKHDDACRMHLADLLGEAERCWAISYARTPRRSRGFASSFEELRRQREYQQRQTEARHDAARQRAEAAETRVAELDAEIREEIPGRLRGLCQAVRRTLQAHWPGR
jgi:hypothetical protein